MHKRGTRCHLGESHREEDTPLPRQVPLPPSGRLSKQTPRAKEGRSENTTAEEEEGSQRGGIYTSPLKNQWSHDQEHPSSCPQTKRTGWIFFGLPLEFTGRAATEINSLIGNKIIERREKKERKKERVRDAD